MGPLPARFEHFPLEVHQTLHRRLRHRRHRNLRLGVCCPFRRLGLRRKLEYLWGDHGNGQHVSIDLAELLVG